MATVSFRDETPAGRPGPAIEVSGVPERVTLRELIRLRVREEAGVATDWEARAEVAERAFLANGFFVLVGDRQFEELDDVVDLAGDPEVVFLKLIPLVGG